MRFLTGGIELIFPLAGKAFFFTPLGMPHALSFFQKST
jgi:hypothetical protein